MSLNRELSWLDFNERVLSLGFDETLPLLERVRFAAIFSGNLDEFFQVRVAALQDRVAAGFLGAGPDGRTATDVLADVHVRVGELAERHEALVHDVLWPRLHDVDIHIVKWEETTEEERAEASELYDRFVHPVLTPLAVDPAHPFPAMSNLSLNIGVLVSTNGHERFARVKVPDVLPRFVQLYCSGRFIVLEQLISRHLSRLFGGATVVGRTVFRVTRNTDLIVDTDEADDLLEAVEMELRRRRYGRAVRLEVGPGSDRRIVELLLHELELTEIDAVYHRGMLGVSAVHQIADLDRPDLRFGFRQPRVPDWLPTQDRSFFEILQDGDRLVHHPYEAFDVTVVDFIRAASEDLATQAIKITLYRTSRDGAIIDALIAAAQRGVQVVAMVELFARFDEGANVAWARRLERAGVHVVYGLVGLKTHSKCVFVVRREGDIMRRYCHIGTGNYNASTAKLYEDFGLFTADEEIGKDVGELFNHLTGFANVDSYRHLVVAPEHLRSELLRLIANEAQYGAEGVIAFKANSLVDEEIAQALYAASAAGVQIDLILRGICCLRPGVPGASDTIRVRSILGRYLEHSRIYHFGNGDGPGREHVLIGSADLMERNLDRRVEVLVPVRDDAARKTVLSTIRACLEDSRFVWELRSDGRWEFVGRPDGHSAQDVLFDEI